MKDQTNILGDSRLEGDGRFGEPPPPPHRPSLDQVAHGDGFLDDSHGHGDYDDDYPDGHSGGDDVFAQPERAPATRTFKIAVALVVLVLVGVMGKLGYDLFFRGHGSSGSARRAQSTVIRELRPAATDPMTAAAAPLPPPRPAPVSEPQAAPVPTPLPAPVALPAAATVQSPPAQPAPNAALTAPPSPHAATNNADLVGVAVLRDMVTQQEATILQLKDSVATVERESHSAMVRLEQRLQALEGGQGGKHGGREKQQAEGRSTGAAPKADSEKAKAPAMVAAHQTSAQASAPAADVTQCKLKGADDGTMEKGGQPVAWIVAPNDMVALTYRVGVAAPCVGVVSSIRLDGTVWVVQGAKGMLRLEN